MSWNSKRLTFDIKYDVLKCNEVMHCIHTVIENQRSRQFSEESSFDYFFRLTDVELQEVKESLNHTMYQNRVFRDVWDKCDFSQPLEQFPSCVSFVFGLKGKNGLGYVFKTFPHSSLLSSLERIETSIRQSPSAPEILLSHLSVSKLMVFNGSHRHEYLVFERLHQISLDAAKQCLIELLKGAKNAIDNLHLFDVLPI